MTLPLVAWAALAAIAVLTAGAAALRQASRIWLRHRVETRMRGWALLDEYLERPQRLLGGAATGISAAAFVLGASLASGYDGDLGLALSILAWAAAVAIVGELLPRAIARRWAPALVHALTPVLAVATAITRPAVALADLVTTRFRRPVPRQSTEQDARDELADLLREGTLEGVGEAEEIAIISGVVAFADKRVRDVMTPRDQVFAVDAALPPRELARRVAQQGFSRVPVVRGTLDDIVGIVLTVDVFRAAGERMPRVRPVATASPDLPCNELLFSMLRLGRQFAVVRAADGETLGIVTLEDLLEELVGEIRDEHDDPLPPGPARPGSSAA
ncbi:MAG: CNNM domain-containing protein [Gemmatimonadaceae bacterium]|nr:CNNM domain-containing protein [Gemmatimonadaceae bacterium]